MAPTGANRGAPGTWVPANATPPVDVPGMVGITPLPDATPWNAGQHMLLRNGTSMTSWSGTDWVGGPAPLSAETRKRK